MRSARRWAAALAIAAGLAASSPGEARAGSGEIAGVVALVAAGLADVGFTAYDLAVAGKGQLPTQGAAIAELVVTTPQALLVTGGLTAVLVDRVEHHPATALAILPSMWVDGLATHAIWRTATDRVRPDLLPALSLMIGANATLSTFAIAHAVKGRLLTRPLGVGAMLLTAPQIAVGIPAALKSDRDRNAWIGAVGWSSALFVHALVSTIVGGPEPDEDPIEPPPPPVPEKPPLLVPASIRVAPAVIAGVVGTVPGIVVTGVLF